MSDAAGLFSMSRRQRRGLALVLLVWAAVMLGLLALRPTTIGRSPDRGLRADEVVVGIDPNTAPLDDLIAVPNLGERRARAIIETRQRLVLESPDRPAFLTPADLEAVPGIGPVLRESMTPYFRFPGGSGDE